MRQLAMHPSYERFAVVRQEGVSVHATEDGRELLSSREGRKPAAFTSDGTALAIAQDDEFMVLLRAADWTLADRDIRRRQGLQDLRRLLGLSAPGS